MHPRPAPSPHPRLRPTIGVASLLLTLPADACTPIFALVVPLYGTAGFAVATSQLLWMLPAVVALKALLFGRLADYGFRPATVDMVLGNIASSLPGALITLGVLLATGIIPFFGTLVACGLVAWLVGRQAAWIFTADAGELRGIFAQPRRLEIALFLALFIATLAAIFPNFMDGNDVDRFPPLYWTLKYTTTFLGLLASVLITVVFEATVIFRRTRKRGAAPDQRLLNAIIKANLWSFLIASLIGAALRLPDRLRDPSFLDFGMFP